MIQQFIQTRKYIVRICEKCTFFAIEGQSEQIFVGINSRIKMSKSVVSEIQNNHLDLQDLCQNHKCSSTKFFIFLLSLRL